MALAVMATIQSGGYVSWWKALLILIVLLGWTRLLTWIDKDAPDAHLPREIINLGMFVGLLLGYALFFFLPGFAIAFSVLLLMFAADIGVYLLIRQRAVGLGDLKTQFRNWINGVTSRKSKDPVAVAGQVLIYDNGGSAQPVPDGESPERPPYDAAQLLLTSPLRYNAERIDMTAGETGVVTYQIDGVRYEGEAMDRNAAGMAVGYLKRVAGLDAAERRKPQTGTFRTLLDGVKREIQVTTFGSTSGESIRLVSDPKKKHDFKLETLGFMPEQVEIIRKSIADGGGVVLLSAPKTQGLSSLLYTVIRSHDAFLHHIHTIERQPDEDLEGITQNAIPANATGAEEAKQVSWVISQEPDVIMVPVLEDARSAVDLAKFASDTRRVYVGLRASSTFDAIKQWRSLVGDDVLAMKNLKMVITGRLVRRLCSACKIGFAPDPTTLRKMNMNPDEVGKLYMARKEPIRDAKNNPVPCTFCKDLGFKGRFGVYELFPIDDDTRRIVGAGGSENQLKQAFRKQRAKTLQEQALVQVKAGETSVEEVLRVLKENPPAGTAPSAGPLAAAPRAAPQRPAVRPVKRPT